VTLFKKGNLGPHCLTCAPCFVAAFDGNYGSVIRGNFFACVAGTEPGYDPEMMSTISPFGGWA
jgi:hypothetical protein